MASRSLSVGRLLKVIACGVVPGLLVIALPQWAAAASVRPATAHATTNPALLRLSDMPKGWTSSPSSSDNSSFPGAAELAKCLGVSASVINSNPPHVDSPDFSSKDSLLSVSDSISTYSSLKSAQASNASLRNAKAPACLGSVLNGTAKAQLQKSFGAGYKVGKVTVTRAPSSDLAPQGANLRLAMAVTYQGTTLQVVFTIFDYVKGIHDQTVDFISVGSTFPTTVMKQLSTLAVSRL